MFDFGIVTSWLDKLLGSVMPGWLATSIECVIVMVALLLAYSVIAMFYIFYERKVCGWIQCRLGPMRVGPWGTIQVFADVIKILTKEIITLWHTDKFLFFLAPFLVIIASMVMFACLPWGNGLQIIDFNVGVFFIVAVSSLGVLGILLAGWSSNSKYTLIGAMRSGAQMISYELSVGISILTIVCLAGTMSVTGIVEAQADGWFLFKGHIPAIIAFLIYIVAANAENNRGPFDLPEAEHELTAGYHSEYSGIHFGFFYLAEYLNLFVVSGIATLLFLGGWMPLHIPGWEGFNAVMDYIPSIFWFLGKAFFMTFIFMWIRWSFPRVRIDQMLALEWRYLMPIGLFNLVLMAVVVSFQWHF
ncbi:MAG: NADH-quinone oxidoreductase subunit NuoH [Sodaliphilus sp.]|nr:NADH-quinone oxidoreductase subunit NuoH [Sodaliphilus sp.]